MKIVPCLTIHAGQYPDHTACASKDEADHTQAPFDVPSLWSHRSTLLPDPFKLMLLLSVPLSSPTSCQNSISSPLADQREPCRRGERGENEVRILALSSALPKLFLE